MTNIIGLTEFVKIDNNPNLVPAKIDTGANTTAVSAKVLEVNGDLVKFILFCEEDKFCDGLTREAKIVKTVHVRSSNGHIQRRHRVVMPIEIGGKRFETEFNLSNREKNTYPVLIGAKTLRAGGFLIDPKLDNAKIPIKKINLEQKI